MRISWVSGSRPRVIDPSGPDLPVRLPRVSTGRFQAQPVTPERLYNTVAQMNGSPACGADVLSMRFIKMCLLSYSPSVVEINHHLPDPKESEVHRHNQLSAYLYPSNNR